MPEEPENQTPDAPDASGDVAGGGDIDEFDSNEVIEDGSLRWSQVWHLPVLLIAGAMLIGGVWLSLPKSEADDFNGALDSVEQFMIARNYPSALDILDRLHPHISRAEQNERARYLLLRADLIYLQQHEHNSNLPGNHEKILANYGHARELGAPFDGMHLLRWAQTLVALGRDADALNMLDQLAPEHRYSIVRHIIEAKLRDPDTPPDELRALVLRFQDELRAETSFSKRRPQEIWAVGLTAQMQIDADYPEDAIDYLNRKIMRFRADGGDSDLAPLHVQLAQAYQRIGRYDQARLYLEQARKHLLDSDPMGADVLVGLANVAMAESGDVQQALGLYSAAATKYPSTPSFLDALIGRADAEAHLGAHPQAIEHFGQAVAMVAEQTQQFRHKRDRVTGIVRSHYDLNMDQARYDRALDYLTVLGPMYPEDLPAEALARFALTHELLANHRRDGADAETDVEQRRAANQEAAHHFQRAGEHYYRHARKITVSDNDAHGASLWKAANCFDNAQLWDKSIDVYGEYVKWRDGDPRQLDAINRLGLSLLADQQFDEAIANFLQLIEMHPKSPAARASFVPLARAYMATSEIEPARRLLENVVTDHPAITPEAKHFREALIELGRLHYNREAFEEAIPVLDMAVQRYTDSDDGAALKFRLGDSYRQLVQAVDEALKQPMPQTRKQAMQQQRLTRLRQAQALFDESIRDYEARPTAALSALDQTFLRNAYLYHADCAYDQGRFQSSIALYDLAAKRYEDHPASLVALIQQVNAHSELGQFQAARVANDRARYQLRRIPDDAFNDPSLPMSREHWEDWLKWTSELNLFDAQASAAVAQ